MNELKVTSILSRQIAPLLIVSVGLPIVVLAGVGLYFVFQHGYLLVFLAALAALSLLARLFLWWCHRQSIEASEQEESVVEPSGDWSEREYEIWTRGNGSINDYLGKNDEWSGLQDHAIRIVRTTAGEYGCTEWDFSVPASLRMFEEVSRRYRRTLQTHVPFVEAVKVSHVRYAVQNQENIGRVSQSYRLARNLWRGVRLLNPAAAVASEVRDYVTGELFAKVSLETQWQLKKVFLQEVLSVAMDLYSGRFNVDDDDVLSSQITECDRERMAVPLDPVRVAVVGQENSGKSSLINALRGEVGAEVDVLPVVGQATVYAYSMNGVEHLHLVELPAVAGGKTTVDQLVTELTESDIVIWVLKADQPARSLDVDLYERFKEHYQGKRTLQKKQPVLLGVLNQIDRLGPVSKWNPPCDLHADEVEKVCNINEALKYNQELLPFEKFVPIALAPNQAPYNFAEVVKHLKDSYQAAVQVQLNRRGREARQRDLGVAEQGKRLARTAKSLFRKVVAG
ncbi:50S ribosome-binding GTPase [Rubripirellula sp.]|nr:GTPase [Rubripirellula sp.]MDB4644960.1 50S ribosome-binding GTPase [Rubripirellula sp.]